MVFDSPSATPPSRNSGSGAAELAAAFRHMSATRDAACSSIDRDRRVSPRGVAPTSTLPPQLNTRSSLGVGASPSTFEYPWSPLGPNGERTIHIGSSKSRSVSPTEPLVWLQQQHHHQQHSSPFSSNFNRNSCGTTTNLFRDGGGMHIDSAGIATAPNLTTRGGLGSTPTTRTAEMPWRASQLDSIDALNQRTRNVRIGQGGSTSPLHGAAGGSPSLATPSFGRVGPINYAAEAPQASTTPSRPTAAALGALFAGEEDAFDRDGIALNSTNHRGASPRVYAPEFEDAGALLPQPDAVALTPPAGLEMAPGADATPLHHIDSFSRYGLQPPPGNARYHSNPDVASPVPKPPPQHHQPKQHIPDNEGGASSLRHTNSMASMTTTEAQQAESAPLSRVPSMLARSASQCHSAVMDFNGIPVPVPPALAVGGGAGTTKIAAQSPPSQFPFNQQKPSKFLNALVEAVALRKQARLVPAVPSEVVHAFDSIVRDGAYFVKYTAAGAPHERFFQVRFVDVQGRAPEPCLSWAVHRTSWSSKGVLNLAAIGSVTLGVHTAAFRRHLIDDRRIRGPMIGGPHRAVLPTSHAFSLDAVGVESEPLSILSLNAEVYEAWVLFLSFIVSVGTAGSTEDCLDEAPPADA